jgi:1-acyl-sn-glycerol-3-phosphate acyltransferase
MKNARPSPFPKVGLMSKYPHLNSGWSLDQRNPKVIQSLMPWWEWLYRYYFRVQTSGWHHIPSQGKVLFVGSHNGGLAAPDMFMMIYDWFRWFGPDRPIYGLMHPHVWKVAPVVAHLLTQVGAVRAHPKMAIAALRRNASVLVYPGGARDMFRPHTLRHKICMDNNQAFIKLALLENIPLIPVISYGAHDTLMVLADCYPLAQQLLNKLGMPWLLDLCPGVFPVYLGIPWGLALGPLPNVPLPVPIHTHVCPPIRFEHYGQAVSNDRDYVNACYRHFCTQMQRELDNLVQRVEQRYIY